MRTRSRRRFGTPPSPLRLMCFLVLTLAFLPACGGDDAEKKPEKAATAVTAAEPVVRDIPVFSEFTGRTEAAETVEIRARVEGFLKERLYTEGTVVKKGDPLFLIEQNKYEEQLKQAEADLEREKAFLAKAETDMKRYAKLYKDQAVSRDEYDVKTTNLKQLEASVEQKKAAVETAKRDLGYTRVTAPITGRIGKSRVKVGSLVGKNENTLLTEISSIDPMKVVFSISERDYLELVKDYEKKEAHAGGEETVPLSLILADDSVYPHQGEADMAERAVDPKTGTLGIRAVFPNSDDILKEGQFAKVRARLETLKDALCIPVTAVMDVQGTKSVFVVGPDNKAESRPVKLGPAAEGLVSVSEGLEKTDKVVVDGGLKLHSGDLVKIEKTPAGEDGKGAPQKDASPDAAPPGGKNTDEKPADEKSPDGK